MKIKHVFISVNAKEFGDLSQWYTMLLERKWDDEPMPSCHEWELSDTVLFQVLDNPKASGKAVVTLRTADLDAHVDRLRLASVTIPDPVEVKGFDTLRFCEFCDPEGNTVGLLEGE